MALVKQTTPKVSLVYPESIGIFPENQKVIGAVSSVGVQVTGASTQFTRDGVNEGNYITDGSEVKRVEVVQSDTELRLESAFSSNLSGASVNKLFVGEVRDYRVRFNGAGGTINDVAVTEDVWHEWRNENGLNHLKVECPASVTAEVEYNEYKEI